MNEACFRTALGACRLTWSEQGLTSFRLPDQASTTITPPADAAVAPGWIQDVIARVVRHLDGDLQEFADLNYDFDTVSPFRRAVYEAALEVKPGQTKTYGWLAEKIGQPPSASRAVGTALGQNPWPLLVPCHRFVGANGKMVGFSAPGGIQTKLRLLALEGAQLFAE